MEESDPVPETILEEAEEATRQLLIKIVFFHYSTSGIK
jgi:hypothetical protein